jgi:hypothetical protein
MKEEVSKRMTLLITTLGTNKNKLSNEMGYYNTMVGNVINMRNLPSFEFLHRLKTTIPNLDMNWLITGNGSMFLNENEIISPEENLSIYKDLIESLKRENTLLREKIEQQNDCKNKRLA